MIGKLNVTTRGHRGDCESSRDISSGPNMNTAWGALAQLGCTTGWRSSEQPANIVN